MVRTIDQCRLAIVLIAYVTLSAAAVTATAHSDTDAILGSAGENSAPILFRNRTRNPPPKFGWYFNYNGSLGPLDYHELMVPRERGAAELHRFLTSADYLPKTVRDVDWELVQIFGGANATARFRQSINGTPVEQSSLNIQEGIVKRLTIYSADPEDPRFDPKTWVPQETLFTVAHGEIDRLILADSLGVAPVKLSLSDCADEYSWHGAKGYPPCTVHYEIALLPAGAVGHFAPVMHVWMQRHRCKLNALSSEILYCGSSARR